MNLETHNAFSLEGGIAKKENKDMGIHDIAEVFGNEVRNTPFLQFSPEHVGQGLIVSPEGVQLIAQYQGLLSNLDQAGRIIRSKLSSKRDPNIDNFSAPLGEGNKLRLLGGGSQSAVSYFEHGNRGFIFKLHNTARNGLEDMRENYMREMLRNQHANMKLAPSLVDEINGTNFKFAEPLFATPSAIVYEYEYGFTPAQTTLNRYRYPLFDRLESFIHSKRNPYPKLWEGTRSDVISLSFFPAYMNFIELTDDPGTIVIVDGFAPWQNNEPTPLNYFTEPGRIDTYLSEDENGQSFSEQVGAYEKAELEIRELNDLYDKDNFEFWRRIDSYISDISKTISPSRAVDMCKPMILEKFGVKYFIKQNLHKSLFPR